MYSTTVHLFIHLFQTNATLVSIIYFLKGSVFLGGSRDLMVRVGLVTQRSWVRVSVLAGIVGGGSEWPVLSSTLNATIEVRPLSKAPNPQQVPERHSKNGCPHVCSLCVCSLLTAVCVCTWMGEMQSSNCKYSDIQGHTTFFSSSSFFLGGGGIFGALTNLNPP